MSIVYSVVFGIRAYIMDTMAFINPVLALFPFMTMGKSVYCISHESNQHLFAFPSLQTVLTHALLIMEGAVISVCSVLLQTPIGLAVAQ